MTEPLIDLTILDELKSLMGDSLPILIEKYEQQSAGYVVAAIDAAARDNAFDVAQTAHPLKSSSRQLGLCPLADLAGFIEDEAKTKDSVTLEIHNAVASLDALYQQSLKALHEALDG